MMVSERIIQALEPLNIPVSALIGDTTKPIYAVIYELSENPVQSADNGETMTAYHIQIDFIGKENLESIVRKATKLLHAAGFARRNKRSEYSASANVYRYMLRVTTATEDEWEDENE